VIYQKEGRNSPSGKEKFFDEGKGGMYWLPYNCIYLCTTKEDRGGLIFFEGVHEKEGGQPLSRRHWLVRFKPIEGGISNFREKKRGNATFVTCITGESFLSIYKETRHLFRRGRGKRSLRQKLVAGKKEGPSYITVKPPPLSERKGGDRR